MTEDEKSCFQTNCSQKCFTKSMEYIELENVHVDKEGY